MASGNRPAGWLRAGRIGRPHGLDGSFHVTGAVPSLLVVGAELRLGAGGETRAIERRAGYDASVIVRLAGISDRTAAESLRGTDLLHARERAPELGADEWWAEELEGCRVHDGGAPVGVVTRLLAFPSCEVLEVALDDVTPEGRETRTGAPLLVPLVGDAVRTVDVQRREIDIDLSFLGQR